MIRKGIRLEYHHAQFIAEFCTWKVLRGAIPLGNNPITGRPHKRIGFMSKEFYEAEKEANKAKARYFLKYARKIRTI